MIPERKVGFWFSEKKKKKLSCQQLAIALKKYGFEAVEIDTTRQISDQGPFVAIIHKFTDLMIDSMNGNKNAENYMNQLQNYLSEHKDLVMIDPLPSLNILLNRYETYKRINQVVIQGEKLHVPSFTQLSSTNIDEIKMQLKKDNVKYPFICKKNLSHGKKSHKMCLIFNEEGLKDVDPPSVAQTFIDHNALLYKIYVTGNKYDLVERPSLKNFAQIHSENNGDMKTIFFNSHDISSVDSTRNKLTQSGDLPSPPEVNHSLIRSIVRTLGSSIEMTMYGCDVIVCPRTNKHYVIDVNVFPGYDGVDDYLEVLAKNVSDKVDSKNKTNGSSNGTNGNHSNGAHSNGVSNHTNGHTSNGVKNGSNHFNEK